MTVKAEHANPARARSRRALVAGSVGNFLEWYEFGVYGFLLVLVMVVRPQGLLPERRRRLELTAAVAAEDAQLTEVSGSVGASP